MTLQGRPTGPEAAATRSSRRARTQADRLRGPTAAPGAAVVAPRGLGGHAAGSGGSSTSAPVMPGGRMTPTHRSVAADDVIDLSQWRLNELPDESSDEDWDDDRELFGPDGRRVETWREGYPYAERMQRREYEIAKRRLQIELLKLQGWVKDTGQKLVLVFEGRDAAGKGGTIKRFTEHLNPRGARVVALDKPVGARARPSGTSSATCSTCRRPGRSCCSTGPGTTAPASSGSWATAPPRSTSSSCARRRSSSGCWCDSGIHLVKLWFSVSRGRAADPVHRPADRPGPAVEALADRPGLAGQVGRLHRGQGGDVPAHRHRRTRRGR